MATSLEDVRFADALPAALAMDASVCVDHIGVAVRSIDAAMGLYRVLGVEVSGVEEVPHEGVRVAMLSLGMSRIELLEPISADSVIGKFLERRGEGLHHVAIRVEDVEAKFAQCVAAGLRLVSDTIKTGAGGHRYFFVHPASSAGVLVEIVGA